MSGNIITGEPISGDEEQQEQSERLAQLQHENAALRAELEAMRSWPDGTEEPGIYGSLSAWRNRALSAESRLDKAYERLRQLDIDIVEERGHPICPPPARIIEVPAPAKEEFSWKYFVMNIGFTSSEY